MLILIDPLVISHWRIIMQCSLVYLWNKIFRIWSLCNQVEFRYFYYESAVMRSKIVYFYCKFWMKEINRNISSSFSNWRNESCITILFALHHVIYSLRYAWMSRWRSYYIIILTYCSLCIWKNKKFHNTLNWKRNHIYTRAIARTTTNCLQLANI